jgi:hypothetical protein
MVMLFIYSLELETLTLKLHDFCNYHKDAAEFLNNIAINFIKAECGDRKAENAFKDNVKDSEITEDGYFLRHSDNTTNQIDVFLRKTTITHGWLGSSVSTKVTKVKYYSITEAALGLPIEKKTETAKKPSFETAKQAAVYDNLIAELKDKLMIRGQNNTVADLNADAETLNIDTTIAVSIEPLSERSDSSKNSEIEIPERPKSLPALPALPALPVVSLSTVDDVDSVFYGPHLPIVSLPLPPPAPPLPRFDLATNRFISDDEQSEERHYQSPTERLQRIIEDIRTENEEDSRPETSIERSGESTSGSYYRYDCSSSGSCSSSISSMTESSESLSTSISSESFSNTTSSDSSSYDVMPPLVEESESEQESSSDSSSSDSSSSDSSSSDSSSSDSSSSDSSYIETQNEEFTMV